MDVLVQLLTDIGELDTATSPNLPFTAPGGSWEVREEACNGEEGQLG